ncbi:MAG TPA: zinc metalloprotease HtpX [Verrucomicrobiae bacterium]|jgi:heat shock protein HtpX|nr:zinc metalloprotease HtpX [Verrucomicrobiae bacterium]
MKNQMKTMVLLVTLSAIFLSLGYMLGGRSGMEYALIMSFVMNFGAYWFSDKMVLAMHQARPIGPGHESGVYEIIQELCQKSGLPMPKVYVTPQMAPNAFATGRDPNHAAVAVTQGILQVLDARELRGVLAHEISHVRNRDILVSTIVACIATAIMYLSHMMRWFGGYALRSSRDDDDRGGVNPLALILTIVLAPLVATLIQAAVSRTREYMADESGAHVCDDPEALASALAKISDPSVLRQLGQRYELSPQLLPAVSHLYIVNHLSGDTLFSLFSTHPPVKQRIERLMAMGHSH